MIPGEVRVGEEPLEGRPEADRTTLLFVNDGDRPIQVGSHLHLPAANQALSFDRAAADGCRLDIPSGTSVRFEPGVSRTVTVVRFGGRGFVPRPPAGTVARPVPDWDGMPVVPFGTPGVPVRDPDHYSGVPTRMADEDARVDAGQAPEEHP